MTIINDDDGTRKPYFIITGNCESVLETPRKQPKIILSNDEDGFRKPHFIITGNCESVLETQRKQPKIIITNDEDGFRKHMSSSRAIANEF